MSTTPTPSASPVTAVIGLGAMGLPMATRLASALPVRGYDVSAARLELAARADVTTTGSAAEGRRWRAGGACGGPQRRSARRPPLR
ncbi:MAG: NAD(P)-binding domain-containing protein [Quadrisphaera sp.]